MKEADDHYEGFFDRPARGTSSMSLVAFYEGTGKDIGGRALADILQWDVDHLEASHDYIQTLFPLPEQSGVNDRAPIINAQVFEAFRSRKDLRDSLKDAFKKMLWFYGFKLVEDGDELSVVPEHGLESHSRNWNTPFDHNHLRITRIIRCLRVLGLEAEALAFHARLSRPSAVSSRSKMYWARAAKRPLNIRPDVDDAEAEKGRRTGPKFLRDWEENNTMRKDLIPDPSG